MSTIVRDTLFIGGEWQKPTSLASLTVISPSTEQAVGQVPDAGASDVHAAVDAARRAFDQGPWRFLSVGKRAEVLERALTLLETRLEEIADLVTAEMGLPTAIAKRKIPGAVNAGRYFLDLARNTPVSDVRETPFGPAAVLREPVGVVASIAPWNGPFNMAVAKIVPALVAGCSMVYKPAPETPLDAFFIAEALMEAGLPPGVFNLVTGGRDAGRALVAHPGVDKVSFTGSTAAGREIARECSGRFARLQLELGGKSAAIVVEDADPDTVMKGVAAGLFANTGQTCSAFSRILVPASRRDEWTDVLVAAAESFKLGDPFDPTTTMGPLVSHTQRQRVLRYIELGRAEGAVAATGGGVPEDLEVGYYVQPTVFVNAHNSMRIAREEIFGPVATVLTYESIDEAIEIANDSDFGLHGAVFTEDPALAAEIARSVRTGTFSINSFTHNTHAPFGGVKDSGIGRELGPEGMEAFHELKTVNLTQATEPFFI
ncbi:aldehyde dehydrogenase [Streptomyces carpinensis]|uniref:aldehyde dehydrogenase (NAD(+)) n=1 Tax=Streptomyces carpinensis TaxID=66369 RepID=A0ABV1VWK3_9ACTN|nr:aldehyde dehydrogenase [Streptomyces carpinensis]